MPSYHYRAAHMNGSIVRGAVVALDERDLAQYLRAQGMELIAAREKTWIFSALSRGDISPSSLVTFSTHMGDVLQAGIPFADALRSVMDVTESMTMRSALADIHRAVMQGTDVAQAFARHRAIFPSVYIALLAAGLASGDMVATFTHLAHYTEKRAAQRRIMRRALRYPLFLLMITSGVIVFMMTMVVPQIVQFLRALDVELPFFTRVLISTSEIFAAWWGGILVTIVGIIVAVSVVRRISEPLMLVCDRVILRIPFLGSTVRRIAEVRFLQSLALLFQSNLGILASLRDARGTLANRALEHEMIEVENRVRSGHSLSDAAESFFSPMVIRIMRAGEHSGQLAPNLDKAAQLCQRLMQEKVEAFLAALEPALTLLMGCVLIWIVLAVLGPIYSNLAKLNIVN